MAIAIMNPTPVVEPAREETTYDSFWINSLNVKSEGPDEPLRIVARLSPCVHTAEGCKLAPDGDKRIVRIEGAMDDLPDAVKAVMDGIFAVANDAIAAEDEAARLAAIEQAEREAANAQWALDHPDEV